MPKMLLNDEQLLELYLKGEENALRILIERHQKKVFGSILLLVKERALAEDIFQDTYIKVIQALRKGYYVENGKFVGWVLRIARNQVMDYFRKTERTPTITNEDGEDIFRTLSFADSNVEDFIIQEETETKIRALIEELPADQKEVLMLRHYSDLSFKEIAEITGTNINTALGRMRYALINMRKLLKKHNIMI